MVAVRTDGRPLSALAGRGSSFELARWLEHDGDGRPPAEVAKARPSAATPRLHGARQGHAAGGGQLARGAARRLRGRGNPGAQVRAAEGLQPAGARDRCRRRRRRGAHALYIEAGRVRVETVADSRGDRPWAPQLRKTRTARRRPSRVTRTGPRAGEGSREFNCSLRKLAASSDRAKSGAGAQAAQGTDPLRHRPRADDRRHAANFTPAYPDGRAQSASR